MQHRARLETSTIPKKERIKQMNLLLASCTDEALAALEPEQLQRRYGIGRARAVAELKQARQRRGAP